MSEWFPELAEFLRIPSISAEPAHEPDVRRAADWIGGFVRSAGGSAEVIDWHGKPLVVGKFPASTEPDRSPTVLCYGHFDVQPADPLELWESPPFEPEIRGRYLYARGVVDDKGQLYMMLRAARDLADEGRLPVNVRFVCDGEEETAGRSVVEFLEADQGPADAAMIFDSTMIGEGMPAFTVATRGLAYFHVTARTGQTDLHSGLFGGAALNAAHALIQALSSVVAIDGRAPAPLRAGVRPPAPEEEAAWKELPEGTAELAARGGRPADAAAAHEFYLRTCFEPAIDINGIATGSPFALKTVLPVEASANVSIRLVAGQEVDAIVAAFTELVTAAAPPEADIEVELIARAAPGVVPANAEAVRLGLDAFERALGVRPLLIRSGGSLPVLGAVADRGVPTIFTGFSLPDANVHAPNERLLVDYVDLGIAAARSVFEALGSL